MFGRIEVTHSPLVNQVTIKVQRPLPTLGEYNAVTLVMKGHEAQELTRRLIDMGYGPKAEKQPEKPKGVGDVSELEYLRSLLFELARK